ncbi:MAG: hypothetical protein ACTH0V_00590 [Microbacteriaceae bacterium]
MTRADRWVYGLTAAFLFIVLLAGAVLISLPSATGSGHAWGVPGVAWVFGLSVFGNAILVFPFVLDWANRRRRRQEKWETSERC